MNALTLVYAIIIFCFLIFAHEFGHLMGAKAGGIRVTEFALGMGPKLFSFRRGETRYSLRAIPIGGFCAMEGENENSDSPRAFHNRPLPAKAVAVVAGPLMNFILAVLILSIMIFSYGTPTTRIAEVDADSPAEAAGIEPGDVILSVNGIETKTWEELSAAIGAASGERIEIRARRGDAERAFTSGFRTSEDGRAIIGIRPASERRVGNIGSSLADGAAATGRLTVMMTEAIGQLFTGEASVKELTGPVGIVHTVGNVAQMGIAPLAQLTALISLNLAIVNMLPFPALDGGRFLFLFVRRLTGKAISDDTEGKIHLAGLLLLFALILFVTVQDITRLIS